MAMLSSYATLLSLSPAPATPPGKSSRAAGSLQFRSRQPVAAASSSVAAALRWDSSSKESRSRAAIFACRAQKYTYNIERDVLLHIAAMSGDNWSIKEDKDHFILKFRVGESTRYNNLDVTTTEDQAGLVIKYKGDGDRKDGDDGNPASSLNVQLTMPPGYDARNAKGMLSSNGWLIIAIPKPKHEASKIDISPPPP